MIINDRIYGKVKITSLVITDLITSQPLQRLKGVCQYGIPDEFYHLKNYSRFEHSIGVMLLLERLGASEEEQVAGLLHDVSHTAFSHLIDWVLGSGKTEDMQDKQLKKFIYSSGIKNILIKYGYHPKRIANHSNFGLLERKIPDACADRIDYALREFPSDISKKCLKNLIVVNKRIVFKNKSSALLFATHFLKRQTCHWGGFKAAVRYRLFADVLREALAEKILIFSDFYKDDKVVLQKVKKSKNAKIKKLLRILKEKLLSKLPKSDMIVYKKFRYVDPLYLKNKKLMRLSENDNGFKTSLKNASLHNKQGVRVPFI
jgi:hypothetical protein